ncbi:SusC/RagA family TonB-linked outer membrane protein [Pedobacter sp. MC2016-14]|uniref:SusC/RagA family TonB-linked outer membrane protein n=1 Tax=Pedobacter sp. MC2016-14 TaxID=2897327 RepID=UPI001E6509CA|nr:SusC/RagA family TonB-linked outer membrane protein [Pedobacter sp. MC2016-14]MCD0490388.1 SusC/RagA family TonB-linked outer membrane protein [Pedobacter sp. MC2016-14]
MLVLCTKAQQKNEITVSEALEKITQKYGTKFAYDHNIVTGKRIAASAINAKTLDEALKNVLYPNNLLFLYVYENNYTIVSRDIKFEPTKGSITLPAASENQVVKGMVTDEKNNPVLGATVRSSLGNNAVMTDVNGRFTLSVPNTSGIITVTYIGYQSFAYALANRKTDVIINLQPDVNMLQNVDIVSTGYQTLSKERTTGSFGVITAKELAKLPSPNVLQRLEGQIPGLQVSLTSGDRTFAFNNTQLSVSSATRTVGKTDYGINIRGTGTISGEAMPLIVVDGAISELDISSLNPNDIDNITVLRDASAASIWGVRAANGVIVITTKQGTVGQAPAINFSATLMTADAPDLSYLRSMNAAQVLDYEKELVDKGFIVNTIPNSYTNAALLNSEGANLAIRLKAGTITQAQYDARVNELSAIDNKSQISKYLQRASSNQQYNLSIGGGSNTSRYFYSASYSKELPNTVGASGSRFTATLNNSWKLFKVATLSTNIKGTFFKYANNGISVGSLYTPTRYTLLPYQLLADENGNGINFPRYDPAYTSTLAGSYKSFNYNYLEELANADNTQKDNNYTANFNLSVPIFKGLSASATYNTERSFSNSRIFRNQNTYEMRRVLNYYTFPGSARNSLGITNGGSLGLINTTQNSYSVRGQLSYNNTISKIHQIDAIAGSEIRETNIGQGTSTLWGYNIVTGLTNANINYTSTASYPYIAGATATSYTTFTGGGYPTQSDKRRRFLSYYSNAAYTLMQKYSLSASVRYDDYNNFGLDRKYRATPLWSAGAKWNASRESFIKQFSWIDNLGFRATYGVNGNLSLTTYPYTSIATLNSGDALTGESYAMVLALANPQLKWEKTYVTNFGADFSVLNGALSGSVEVYQKRGRDLLFSFPINSTYAGTIGTTSGITLLYRNTTSMNGNGVDINLRSKVLSNEKMEWTLGGTFSYNNNKIIDTRFASNSYNASFSSYPQGVGAIAGYAIDKLLVYRFAGLDANGLTQIYAEDGSVIPSTTSTITSFGVLKDAGRITAPYYGSLNTTFRYKQFSLYALATYQFGSVFIKPNVVSYITNNRLANYDLSAAIADRWRVPGDELKTNVPALNSNFYSLARYQYSDINVLKGDYLRLRQVSLSYQLPAGYLNKYKIKGAQLGVSVNNLGLLWRANKEGYDPDFSSTSLGGTTSLPAARSYNFSLNLNF